MKLFSLCAQACVTPCCPLFPCSLPGVLKCAESRTCLATEAAHEATRSGHLGFVQQVTSSSGAKLDPHTAQHSRLCDPRAFNQAGSRKVRSHFGSSCQPRAHNPGECGVRRISYHRLESGGQRRAKREAARWPIMQFHYGRVCGQIHR